MRLSFEPKPIEEKDNLSEQSINVINKLLTFILNNKDFRIVIFTILERWKKPVDRNEVENVIKTSYRAEDGLSKNENYNEFIDAIKEFYDCTEDEISDRRGKLLELLWSKVGTYNMCEYTHKFEEAYVLDSGMKISNKDIDFIYVNDGSKVAESKFIELHECKSSAKSTMRTPLRTKHRRKLKLMEDTASIAKVEKISCNPLLITFGANSTMLNRVLERHGFRSIKIVARDELEARVE